MSDPTSRPLKFLPAVLALAMVVWLFNSWNSEERRVLRRLNGLREVVEKSAGEGNLEAVNRARKLGSFFAHTFQVEGEPLGVLTDRKQLGQILLLYRRHTDSLGVGFSERELRFIEGGGRKTAEMELVATLTGRTGTDFRRESYRLAFGWVEEDGEWVIEGLQLLEVLEGNPLSGRF